MGKEKRDNEIITLGSGDLYFTEYDASQDYSNADTLIETVCVPENILGRIKGGAKLTYEAEFYTAKDDKGVAVKTCVTEEKATLTSGIITWNGKTLDVLTSTATVATNSGATRRIVKIGGADNYDGKSYILVFHHSDKVDGDVWLIIRGQQQGSLELQFAKDEETTVDAEFSALPSDKGGTLITYVEQIKNA